MLKAYRALNGDLTFEQRQHLDPIASSCAVNRDRHGLDWLRQAIGAANLNDILAMPEMG